MAVRNATSMDIFISYEVLLLLSHSLGSILFHWICGCMFCIFLFNFCILCILFVAYMYSYCYVRSVLGIVFHCVVLCIVCV